MSLPKGTTLSLLSGEKWACDVAAKTCRYGQTIAAGSSPPKVTSVLNVTCDYAGGDGVVRLGNYTGNRWDVKIPVRAPVGCDPSSAAGKLGNDGGGQVFTTQSIETTPEITPLGGVKSTVPTLNTPVQQKGLSFGVIVAILSGALVLMVIVSLIGWTVYKRRRYKVDL